MESISKIVKLEGSWIFIKIKSLPTDFIVKEHINIPIYKSLNDLIDKDLKSFYIVYRLTKENISTLKLSDIFLKNNIKVGFIGLKDKYSLASQYFCFFIPNFKQINKFIKKIEDILKSIKSVKHFEFIGYIDKPLRKQDLIYNEFKIILRDIDSKELENYVEKLNLFKDFYFLNFYDDQRFPIYLDFSIDNFISILNKIKNDLFSENPHFKKEFSNDNLSNVISNYLKEIKSIFKIDFLKDKENLTKIKLDKKEILFSFEFNIFLNVLVFLAFDKKDLKIYVSKNNLMVLFDLTKENKQTIQKIIELIYKKNFNSYKNRKLFIKVNNLDFNYSKDELSRSDRYKVVLNFNLESGGYATTFIKHLIPINPVSSTKTKFIKIN